MKLSVVASILLPLILTGSVLAQTSSPAATPTTNATPTTATDKKIEDLKERLATKVAELSQTQRRAIFGTVKATSISTATIETTTKDIKIELTDDIQIFQNVNGKRTKLTTEDLAKGDIVSVFGEYDATLDLLKAKIIFIQDGFPQHIAGTVTEVDAKAFTLTVKPAEGPSYIVDIEKATKTSLWTNAAIAKSGFSKIQVGDSVHVVGTPVPKKENRLSAERILNLGNLSGAPLPTPSSFPTKESSPSPTLKATPTPKPTPKPSPTSAPTPTP
jgi:hypothetical protein